MSAVNRAFDAAEGGAANDHDRKLSLRGSRPDVFEAKEQAKAGATEPIEATEKVAQETTLAAGSVLWEPEARQAGSLAVHILFGAVAGALYGATVPRRNTLIGMGYGAAVWAASVPALLPLFGLAKPPQEYPAEYHAKSVAAHLVYGAVTDTSLRLLGRIA